MAIKIIKIGAKSIFTKSKLGVDYSVNQYVGCGHNCTYCYAKFIQKWRPADYGKWGTWVEAKINAPELVKNKIMKGYVFMSSISDPYQPIEKDLKLTQQILENLDKRTKLIIQTKSDLVLRDIDLLKKFKDIEIGFTINSFEAELKKIFEPFSPANEKRINALKSLKKEGLKTYTFVSPIIPGLIDLKGIITKTKYISDYYWFEFINLRGAGREFTEILQRRFPKSYKVVVDKMKFRQFIKDCGETISSQKVKVQGMVVH